MCKNQDYRIFKGGMGGFLTPPTYPEHYMHVRGDGSHLSLSYVANNSSYPEDIRKNATKILRKWNRPVLETDAIQNWIFQVLGYFRNCYTKDPAIRDVNNKESFYINKVGDPWNFPNNHLGILHIKNYYPEYVPCEDDFAQAYWGSQPKKGCAR